MTTRGAVGADGRASRSQITTLERGQHAKYPPHAFTEHGAIMAAMVLSSSEAVAMSVFVVRAFTRMRSGSQQMPPSCGVLRK